MTETLDTIVSQALERIAQRDGEEHHKVLTEIRAKGTWWAAQEIIDLRRRVQTLFAECERAGRERR